MLTKNNNFQKIVIVYKKSKLDLYLKENKDSNYLKLKNKDHIIYQTMLASHEAQKRSFDWLQNFLQVQGLPFRTVYRANFRKESELVITVGGDGTLLDASHKMMNGIILGFNSDPKHSGGFLCAANQNNFSAIIDDLYSRQNNISEIKRLGADIDGQQIPYPLLNDLLIAHKNPADTVRYQLEWNHTVEEHKSSGVWICAPAGSSGAMVSAGGYLQKLNDQRIQFKVREAFCTNGYPHNLHDFVSKDQKISFISKMRKGAIYLDGPHKRIDFPAGARLSIQHHAAPLKLVTIDNMEQRRKTRVTHQE